MNRKNKIKSNSSHSFQISFFIFLVAFVAILLPSCTSDDLAFDVIESPVLAVFEEDIDGGMLRMTATFYELDKSGILDQNIGIDSTVVSDLPVEIFINENNQVGSVTTDDSGQAIFETAVEDLQGASRLEWVGNYNNTPFRIYRNF